MSTKDKLSILVIEDNLGDFVIIEEYLKESSFQYELYNQRCLREAEAFLTAKNKIDVILLDLSLPDGQGESMITRVLNIKNENTILIVLTGFGDKEFGIKSLSLGVSDYLLKDELTPSYLTKSILYNLERARINKQVKHSEKRYRDLFQLSPIPKWVYEIGTFKFLDVNNAAIKHYGYSYEEFLSMTILDIRPKEDIIPSKGGINFLSIQDEVTKNVYRHKKKNGEIIYVSIHASQIDFDGIPAELVLANDITERRNYIRAIETQNTKMQEIAWIQSHKVRAPLARIMGLINMIDEVGEIEEYTIKELLQLIKSSGKEMDEIIHEIAKKADHIHHSVKS
ncbi:PAS domain S-box protein [Penaeicola halotolerans]|uniref:PAS domain S-box protein n=1 Tax=Penaeicola halotolerans TaxID=2793196 RepID=UPI001CF806F4|nr:PAS domain S-box protein [Penaeicola halotolerans]